MARWVRTSARPATTTATPTASRKTRMGSLASAGLLTSLNTSYASCVSVLSADEVQIDSAIVIATLSRPPNASDVHADGETAGVATDDEAALAPERHERP